MGYPPLCRIQGSRIQHFRKTVGPSPRGRRSRGGSLLVFTFVSVLVVIPMLGLAIDGAISFWVKARLSTALDAAALAAGRSPTSNASTIVQQYVYANFPVGWLGTSFSVAPTANIDYPNINTRRATRECFPQCPAALSGNLRQAKCHYLSRGRLVPPQYERHPCTRPLRFHEHDRP